MKKTVISAGVISVMMMGMSSAFAAGMSPELSVKGQMAVPTCEVVLSEGGVFDLGKLSNTLVKATTATPLSHSYGDLLVDCEAETYLNFTVVDNREGTASATDATYFGLGNVNGDGKLGYYRINMIGGTVDGGSPGLFSAVKGATTFTSTPSVYVDKNKVTGWAAANNQQTSGKKFMGSLQIEPVLASSASMGGSISESVTLDGSATLNFAYGI